jgi:hypothetical protein
MDGIWTVALVFGLYPTGEREHFHNNWYSGGGGGCGCWVRIVVHDDSRVDGGGSVVGDCSGTSLILVVDMVVVVVVLVVVLVVVVLMVIPAEDSMVK